MPMRAITTYTELGSVPSAVSYVRALHPDLRLLMPDAARRPLEARASRPIRQASMRSVSEAIETGLEAHAEWKQRLRAAADARISDVGVADAANENGCDFGKWLQREAPMLSASEQGADLELVKQLHADFHRVAGDTLAAALRGDRARYEASVAIDGGFARASIALISAVTAWKGRVAARR